MVVDRRTILTLSAAGAASLVFGGTAKAASPASLDEVRQRAIAYFTKNGFPEAPPLDLITGEDFNDGLRFDDSRSEAPAEKSVSVQYSARTEDIEERDRPGVLAGFNTIVVRGSPAEGNDGVLDGVLDFLVNDMGLDPDKLLFVSTKVFRPHAERIDVVRSERVLERPLDEAQRKGDGSGFFAPAGHPARPAFDTVAIYYPEAGEDADSAVVYPPPGYIEIAEIGLSPDDVGAAIGLERLAMAAGAPTPSFKESQQELLRALEKEAERRGKPLPPGYAVFAAL